MNVKLPVTAAVCLLVGVGIGRLLPVSGEAASADPVGVAAVTPRTNAPVREANQSAQQGVGANAAAATRSGTAAEIGNAPTDPGVVAVPSALIRELSLAAGVRTLDQPLFGGDARVEEALGITEAEKATLQTAWDTAKAEVRQIEAATMKSEALDEWSVRITVPDLASSMTGVAGDFRSQAGQVLGADRAAAFLAAKQVDGVFSSPEGERTVVVTTEETGDGQWRYRMELDGAEGRRVWVGENIPDEIRHLTEAAGIARALGGEGSDEAD